MQMPLSNVYDYISKIREIESIYKITRHIDRFEKFKSQLIIGIIHYILYLYNYILVIIRTYDI